jgi:hypothetical protein
MRIMKTITKALVGTLAAGAAAMTSATPAMARDRDDGISTGEVIAGALILGGIAAVVASSDNDRDDRYSGRYDDYDYGRSGYDNGYGYNRGNSRNAVEQCVRSAERTANRYSYGGRADVTDIRSVQRTRDGFNVRGRIAVNTQGRNWRSGDRNYGRGWNGDYRGANSRLRGYDSGSFTCKVRYGRVADLDFNGIRGLS